MRSFLFLVVLLSLGCTERPKKSVWEVYDQLLKNRIPQKYKKYQVKPFMKRGYDVILIKTSSDSNYYRVTNFVNGERDKLMFFNSSSNVENHLSHIMAKKDSVNKYLLNHLYSVLSDLNKNNIISITKEGEFLKIYTNYTEGDNNSKLVFVVKLCNNCLVEDSIFWDKDHDSKIIILNKNWQCYSSSIYSKFNGF